MRIVFREVKKYRSDPSPRTGGIRSCPQEILQNHPIGVCVLHVVDWDAGGSVTPPKVGIAICQHTATRPERFSRMKVAATGVSTGQEHVAPTALDVLRGVRNCGITLTCDFFCDPWPVSPGWSNEAIWICAKQPKNFPIGHVEVLCRFLLIQVQKLPRIQETILPR